MGSFLDTAVADGIVQTIQEQDATSGPRPKRADLLQHAWGFSVPPGGSYAFRLRASRVDSGNDGDDFLFRYSTNGGASWNPMLTVNNDSLVTLEYTFVTDVGGFLLVEASDTDRTRRHKNHATLSVDSMCVEATSEPPPPPPTPTSDKRIVGYYTSWSIYVRDYLVSDIPAEKITHLNYAFADLLPDGTLGLFDPFADTQKVFGNEDPSVGYKGNFQQLNILKSRRPHLKTLISVGGWTLSDHFSDVFAYPQTRNAFCQSGLDFVSQYDFDGMDIDWEYPGDPGAGNSYRPGLDRVNYIQFLQECGPAFQNAGKLLTVTTSCNQRLYSDELDLPNMVGWVDWVNLMSYDLHGSWEPVTAHHSQLFRNNAEPSGLIPAISGGQCVQGHMNNGVPRGKIVLGVPTYGRSYANVNTTPGGSPPVPGLFQPFSGLPQGTWDTKHSKTGIFDYKDIVLNVRPNATRTYDSAAQAPSLLWSLGRKRGHGFMSYDDPESVCAKGSYIQQQDLGGFMFWELSGDIQDHPQSLVDTMFCSINPSSPGCANVCGP